MAERRATDKDEEKFRDSLLDAAVLVEKVGHRCKDVGELLELLRLGLENDGQLRLLMLAVAQPADR